MCYLTPDALYYPQNIYYTHLLGYHPHLLTSFAPKPLSIRYQTYIILTCFKPVPSMLLTCSHYASSMFQTCFQHKSDHFRVLPFTQCSMPFDTKWTSLGYPICNIFSLLDTIPSQYAAHPLLIDPQIDFNFISTCIQADPNLFKNYLNLRQACFQPVLPTFSKGSAC